MRGGRKCITKIDANLAFQVCISFFQVFQDTWRSNKEILERNGTLPCLVP